METCSGTDIYILQPYIDSIHIGCSQSGITGVCHYFPGHQGTGVVSYFVFLRWLFFLNFLIFLLCFWVIVFFQVAFPIADYDRSVTGVDDSASFTGVALADTCSAQYQPNVTSDALSLVLDFIQGTVSTKFYPITCMLYPN